MRTYYFHLAPGQGKEYAIQLVRKLAREEGIEEVDNPANADSVWVSVCDIDKIGLLKQARRYGKPVISGGFISFLPIMRLWSDYVCVGEAYAFIRAYAAAKRLEDLEMLPNCATPTRPGQIDEVIEYERNPIVRTSKRAYYYYSGRGCPQRCKFCLLSWSRKHQQVPEHLYRAAVSAVPDSGKLYMMASMLTFPKHPDDYKLGTMGVRLIDYVAARQCYGKRVRTGVEFFSQEMRRKMGKPISNDIVTKAYQFSAKEGTELALYHIVGIPGDDPDEYLSVIPDDGRLTPRVLLCFTYLDPQPLTPIADWDIREKTEFDVKTFLRRAIAKNRRIRTQGPKYMAHSSWRTIQQRATTLDEAEFAWSLRNEKNNDVLIEKTERKYPRLLGTKKMAEILG